MNPETASTEPVDLSKLSDQELIERFCKDRSDQEVANEFWQRHSRTILDALKRHARLCPSGCDQKSFVDASFSRAYINLFTRICGFKFRGFIAGWLYKLAGTAALDERRAITGHRAKAEEETKARAAKEKTGELKADEEPQKYVRWEDLEPLIDNIEFRSQMPRIETGDVRDPMVILRETRAQPVPQPDQIFDAKEPWFANP
jgi:hypothetical protein